MGWIIKNNTCLSSFGYIPKLDNQYKTNIGGLIVGLIITCIVGGLIGALAGMITEKTFL